MHSVIIIVNAILLSLHSVITLLKMSLWGPAPTPYHPAAEGKAPLIPPLQISFPRSCAQAQLRFAGLSLPDLICSLLVIAACPTPPEQGAWACCPSCSAFTSQTPLCCSGWGLNLTPVPLQFQSNGISDPKSANHPHPEGTMGPPGYSCLLGLSEHHLCQHHVSS